MDVVPDIDTITIVLANDYARDYESWISKKANLAEMEITIPKFTQDNWNTWK